MLLVQEDFDAAKQFAEETIRLADDNADAHRVLGHVFLISDDFSAAETSFKRAIALDPNVTEYWLALARTQIEAGDRDSASKTVTDAYAENPDDIQIAALLISSKVDDGDLDAALMIAKDLRSQQPDSAKPIALEAEVLARQGDLAGAAALYDTVLAVENSPHFAARAYALRNAAGLPNKDEPLLKNLEQNPLNTAMRLLLAQGYQTDGKNDMAAREYQKVMEIAPEDPVALNNLAWMYMESGDQRAEDYARRAYALDPENSSIIDTLGWILVQKGAVDEGAELLRSAAERSPDSSEIQYHLAAAMAKQGMNDEARQILEVVLKEGGVFASREAAVELLLQL
jgi:Tfp pilus assembly protein PilF